MEFSYLQEDSKSSSDENIDRSSDQNNDDDHDHHMGIGRSYECVFCKRGFTTAQALGGHMNIHRKDRANNNKSATKTNFAPPSSSKLVVDHDNYGDLGFYSTMSPSHLARGGYYSSISSTTTTPEVDSLNYHQIYFPSHVQYSEMLCVENQRMFGQDWRGLSLYTNPLNKDKIENNNEVGELDLELRLGHYP